MFDWLLGGGSRVPTLTVQETWERVNVKKKQDAPALIDVREVWEFTRGHARGAHNIPLGELRQRLSEIPQDRDILLICQSGNRSSTAARMLMQAGYTRIFNVSGGTSAWYMHHLPLG